MWDNDWMSEVDEVDWIVGVWNMQCFDFDFFFLEVLLWMDWFFCYFDWVCCEVFCCSDFEYWEWDVLFVLC